jgi:hypothetical protein
MLQEHGPDAVGCIIQGKLLADDHLGDAGLVCQVKLPKPVPDAATDSVS